MKFDPEITIDRLLTGIPSAAVVFEKFGIPLDGNGSKTLQQLCADGGIRLDDFLRGMDEIDWNPEANIRANPDARRTRMCRH